jgi:hypothetical protein
MSAVIDSKMQMLDEDEILSIFAQETDFEYSAEQLKAVLLTEVNELGALIIREGNTFIVVNPTKNPEVVLFRALNADTLKNYVDNVIKAGIALAKKGVKYLVIDFSDEKVLRLLKNIAAGLGNSGFGKPGSGYEIKKGSNGYRAIVKIEAYASEPEAGLSSIEGAQ